MFVIRHSIKCFVPKRIPQYPLDLHHKDLSLHRLWRFYCSSSAISHPTPDGCEKVYTAKVKNMVEEIAKLTLIELADLNECLKKKLNIKDAPMMMGAAFAAPAANVVDEEEAPQITKSSFTVKLLKIDSTKKVPIIKEIKNVIEGMNLVQAKKFVESVPQVIKADIAKDEADKLKQALEAAGGTCEIS